MAGMGNILDKKFKLSERGTPVKTEIMAGATTFMTMAYILAVNPSALPRLQPSQKALWVSLREARQGLLR